MVGLVLVSHSRRLAEAASELIRRTVSPNPPLASSGGVGEEREELGTDAIEIQEAITSVFSSEGVLVLMDMGSAILSAETALDFLDPDIKSKVLLSSAPLVEGGIAAAVQAQLGSPISEVAKAARESLLPKQDHMQDSGPVEITGPSPAASPDAETFDVTLTNEHGLHLRPAATLIRTLAQFPGDVLLENRTAGRGPVAAKSLVDVTRLQIRKGDSVRFSISSSDPKPLVEAIRSMVASEFGESSGSSVPSEQIPESQNDSGTFAVSRGIAIGTPVFLNSLPTKIPTDRLESDSQVASEISRLQAALKVSSKDFDSRVDRLRATLRPVDLEVFAAQRMILLDPTILREVEEKIRSERLNGAAAWHEVLSRHATEQEQADDPYFRARAADLREVRQIALSHLIVGDQSDFPIEQRLAGDQILICDELTPSLADNLSHLGVAGVVQLGGGPTSHGAILARALNLPAIGGAKNYVSNIRAARTVAIHGGEGSLWIDPPVDILARLKNERQSEQVQQAEALQMSQQPAYTADGSQIAVGANAGSAKDILHATTNGAESVGLFRSEFLFQHLEQEPGEQEQLDAYLEVFRNNTKNFPITVRLLDIGADKPVKFLPSQPEANPFLGVRGVRLLFANAVFLQKHLRALLRAATAAPLKLLVPMVTDLSEILRLKQLIQELADDLAKRGIPHRWPVPFGVMIETPSAALLVEEFLPHVDFLSIGTNDLTQYLLCAERGNPELSAFADPLHPAVIRICQDVIRKSHERGIGVSICGEVASDPEAIPILLGIGLRELSVAAAAVPRTKLLIRKLDAGRIAAEFAAKRGSLCAASDVRRFSQGLLA